jgi:hypothetical protein
MKPIISQTYLKSLLEYNPDSGVFTWIAHHGRNNIGDKATRLNNGYIRIGIESVGYSAHRLAFIYMTGEEPEMVDHINGLRNDNRWINLRSSNSSENTFNSTYSHSSTGIRGISQNKQSNKFEVRIKPKTGKIIYRAFSDLDEAICFNNKIREQLFMV